MKSSRVQRQRTHVRQTSSLPQSLQRAIGLLLIVVVGGGVLFASYYSWFMKTVWNEGTTKNIVIIPKTIDVETDKILFASISYKEDRMSLNSLPANDTVQVPGGYGGYPLKSVFPLLGLDQKSDQTVVATYTHLLGIPINEVWVTDDEAIFNVGANTKDLAQTILLGKLSNPLGLKERVKLYQFMNDKQPQRVDYNSLEDWQAKQAVRYVGTMKDCRIAVLNTTTVAGLGSKVAQVLERSGMTVVRLTDASPTAEKSQLTIQPGVPACQELAAHLRQLFPDQIEVIHDTNIMNRSRSEAEVVLGQDIGAFLK